MTESTTNKVAAGETSALGVLVFSGRTSAQEAMQRLHEAGVHAARAEGCLLRITQAPNAVHHDQSIWSETSRAARWGHVSVVSGSEGWLWPAGDPNPRPLREDELRSSSPKEAADFARWVDEHTAQLDAFIAEGVVKTEWIWDRTPIEHHGVTFQYEGSQVAWYVERRLRYADAGGLQSSVDFMLYGQRVGGPMPNEMLIELYGTLAIMIGVGEEPRRPDDGEQA